MVVITPEDSVLHELNSTASYIWNHASGERTTAEIAQLLAVACGVDEETALRDTQDLVEHLSRTKLLLVSSTEGEL